MQGSVKSFDIVRVSTSGSQPLQDLIAVEEPLEIRISHGPSNNRQLNSISVTMRTPGHDKELALGFLFTEGIIKQPDQVMSANSPSSDVVEINLRSDVIVHQQSLQRNFYTTSSCGVCGKSSIEAIRVQPAFVNSKLTVKANILESLPEKLRQAQESFRSTGGLHASALFDRENILVIREDVGRHNALDKVIGYSLLNHKLPGNDSVLLVSGRASFELVQKAAVAGIAIVAAIGAPSSLAVELAQETGITLIGFLNKNRFNIYSHANRIIFS
jgi:FdhD protein